MNLILELLIWDRYGFLLYYTLRNLWHIRFFTIKKQLFLERFRILFSCYSMVCSTVGAASKLFVIVVFAIFKWFNVYILGYICGIVEQDIRMISLASKQKIFLTSILLLLSIVIGYLNPGVSMWNNSYGKNYLC